jgi:hypothetical protein
MLGRKGRSYRMLQADLAGNNLSGCKIMSYLNKQEGGSHYMQVIQPIEYIYKNKIGYIEGNVIKYITRHREKNGAEDIRKVIHYCEMLLEMEYDEK